MARMLALRFLTITVALTAATSEVASPIAKVLEMLGGLEAKIVQEGEVAHKDYASYAEWCEDTARQLQNEIKTGKGWVMDLEARITKESATIEELTAKIEDLSSKIATAEADLAAATKIRGKEAADFAAAENELKQVLSALGRATKILSEEMSKGGAAMVQFSRTSDVVKALSALVQASVLNSADGNRLTALVQSSTGDDEDAVGEPDVAAYEGQSGGIIEVLEGLRDKAEEQLASARKSETTAQHNFQMLKQSLEDESSVGSNEMAEAKNNMAASKEAKGVAGGDLDVTSKDLSADVQVLSETHQACMQTAEQYETATKSRDEELAALAAAKKVIKETTGGADDLSYSQASFLQVGSVEVKPKAVLRFMLELARKQNSKSLAQLARRISSTIRINSARGKDPFGKVKDLISEMIGRLEDEAGSDASHKAYCDKETSETTVKKNDKTAEIDKLRTAIDDMTSRIAVLEEEVALLAKELATLAKEQAGYDKWYAETEDTFVSNKADMEAGVEGVKVALKVLRDYYAKSGAASHGAAAGAGDGIVGLLEVVESDFTKGLAGMQSTYDNQKAAYEARTKEIEITTTAKNQDMKYKKKEKTDLTKALKETTSDRSGVQTELDAVSEYLAKIKEQCVEKAEPYEETKRRRAEEIAGLKEALEVLEGEAVLLQRGRRSLRARA